MTMREYREKYGVTKKYKRVLRNRIILGVIAVSIVLGITIGVVNKVDAAYKAKYTLSNYIDDTECIYYKSVMVRDGDTLTSIANYVIEEYSMDVPTDVIIQAIFDINNMVNPDYIKSGNFLIVPYFDKIGK